MAGRQPYDSEGPLARNNSPHTYAHGLNLSVSMFLCGFLLLLLPVAGGPSCLDFSFLLSPVSWSPAFFTAVALSALVHWNLGP